MTPIGYAKPEMFLTPVRPYVQQPNNRVSNCFLSSWRLQPTSGHSHCAFSVLGTRKLPRFLPSQRHDHHNVTNRIPLLPLPAPRFSQPFSRSYADGDSRVCSTPLALPGLQPTELDFETITHRHPMDWRFRRSPPFMASFRRLGDIPAYHNRGGLSVPAISSTSGPSSSCEDRLPLWV